MDEIVEKMKDIGIEVEQVDEREELRELKIERVLKEKRNKDEEKLKVMRVDKGEGKKVKVV